MTVGGTWLFLTLTLNFSGDTWTPRDSPRPGQRTWNSARERAPSWSFWRSEVLGLGSSMRSARTHALGSAGSWLLGIFPVAGRPPEVDSDSSWKQAAAGLCPGWSVPARVEPPSLLNVVTHHRLRLNIRFQLLVWKQHLTTPHNYPSYLWAAT